MAWAPDYATLAELKAFVNITDTVDDTPLGQALTAASRLVDEHCGRQFGQLSAAAARYYSAQPSGPYSWGIEIDDLATTDDLVVRSLDADGTYSTTLTEGTDFVLGPANAIADARPWTFVELSRSVSPRAVLSGPKREGWEIEAKWGWAAVPAAVKSATLLQSARLFSRRTSPFGIAGSPEQGSELRLLARVDPDVAVLLGPLRRVWAVAGD